MERQALKAAKLAVAPQPVWHIVRTRPSLEMRAGEEVLALGQTVYVPQFRKEFRNRNKGWTTRYYPLMGGYFFIMASPHWARVLGCPSVQRVLRDFDQGEDGTPIPIDDRTVREIRTRQENGDFDEMRVHGRINAGETLKVAEGPLIGLRGIATEIGDRNVVMMLQMFGREIRAKAPVAKLQRAG